MADAVPRAPHGRAVDRRPPGQRRDAGRGILLYEGAADADPAIGASGKRADGRGTMSELWLVRHGETEWSRSGAHTGRTDIALTETGREQARALGRRLDGREFALVLTSPLQRARDTCALAGFGN